MYSTAAHVQVLMQDESNQAIICAMPLINPQVGLNNIKLWKSNLDPKFKFPYY